MFCWYNGLIDSIEFEPKAAPDVTPSYRQNARNYEIVHRKWKRMGEIWWGQGDVLFLSSVGLMRNRTQHHCGWWVCGIVPSSSRCFRIECEHVHRDPISASHATDQSYAPTRAQELQTEEWAKIEVKTDLWSRGWCFVYSHKSSSLIEGWVAEACNWRDRRKSSNCKWEGAFIKQYTRP